MLRRFKTSANCDKSTPSPSITHVDSEQLQEQANSHRKIGGILTCIGGVLVYLALGSLYTFGNMLPYMASYLAYKQEGDDLTTYYLDYVSKCNYIFAFTIAGQSVFFPIGGKLGQMYGLKLLIIIGAAIQSILGVLCSYFVADRYDVMYVTYGLCNGIGIGLAYPNILVLVMRWYPNAKGLVNGIVLCGFGVSALIFDKVQTAIINPHNLEQLQKTGFAHADAMMERFPFIFLYLGGVYFAMQMIGVLLMSVPPKKEFAVSSLPPQVQSQQAQAVAVSTNDEDEQQPLIMTSMSTELRLEQSSDQLLQQSAMVAPPPDFDFMDVVSDLRFWQLYLNFFIDGIVIVFVATQWKIYSNDLGVTDDAYLSLIGSISSAFNGGGRILFGWILDKNRSFRFTMGCVNIVEAMLLFTWPYCFGQAIPMIWTCLLFGCFAANFSVFPTTISMFFGEKNVGINVGLIFSSQIFSAFLSMYALDALRTSLRWEYMCFVVASIQLLGALVSFSVKSNHMRGNDKKYQNS